PGHFIDFMATFTDITGTQYPEEYKGNQITPMEGESLMPAFLGDETEERTLFFEHEKHCAIRKGNWKLAKVKEKDWELYNIREDRTELNNLKDNHLELV